MSFTEYFKNFKTLEPCYRLLFLEPVNSQIVNSLLAQHAFHIQINQSLNQPPLFNSPIKAITCRARYHATGDHPLARSPLLCSIIQFQMSSNRPALPHPCFPCGVHTQALGRASPPLLPLTHLGLPRVTPCGVARPLRLGSVVSTSVTCYT